MNIGYQLSSAAPYLQDMKSMREAFQKIAAVGYKDVQLQGASPDIADEDIARALKDAGLNCVATQEDYPFGFGEDPERYINRAVACGARYLTFALIPREVDTIEKLEEFAGKIRIIYEKVKAAGLTFAFHPITSDCRKMGGVPVYERLMDLLPNDMQLTFCVYSAFGTEVTAEEVFEKFRNRVDLVHFKDSIPGPDGKAQLMPLGQGTHDWQPIFDLCAKSGVKYIFGEQERWQKDAFECAADTYKYLHSLK